AEVAHVLEVVALAIQEEGRESRSILSVVGPLGRDDERVYPEAKLRPVVSHGEHRSAVQVVVRRSTLEARALACRIADDAVWSPAVTELAEQLDRPARVVRI